MTGIHSLDNLMDYPWVIRLVSLLYSLLSLFVMYLTGRKFFNRSTAYISVILLLTSIPFLNYATQVRGYGLSMLCFTAILYYVMSCETSFKISRLFIIVVLTALLIYTIPSNLFFVVSLIVFYMIRFMIEFLRKLPSKEKVSKPFSNLWIGGTLFLGIGLSLIFYIPVFNNVFFNEYVTGSVSRINLNGIGNILNSFISYQWTMLILFVLGISLLLTHKRQEKIKTDWFIMFLFLFIFPFIMYAVKGNSTFDRIFIVLIPVFTILISAGIVFIIQKVDVLRKFSILWLILIMIISNISYVYGMNRVKNRLMHDITGNGRSQENLFNYYQWYFHPNHEVRQLSKIYKPGESVVIVAGGEPHDLPEYLQKYKIPYYEGLNDLDSLSNIYATIYIFITHPENFKKYMNNQCIDCNAEMISQELSYHNLYKLECNSANSKKQRIVLRSIFCDAELLNQDKLFISDDGKYLFKKGNLQTNELSFSGEKSMKLTQDNPFGMDIELKTKPCYDYEVSVWRYSTDKNGVLVASAKNSSDFYIPASVGSQKNSKGWELIKLKFRIPKNYPDNTLNFYLWNNGKTTVYFDDFRIQEIALE